MTRKTTIYLPEDLRAGVTEEAKRRGISESEVIRQAVAASLSRPRPRAGFLDCPPIAENAEQLLGGYAGTDANRLVAGQALLDAEPMPVEDWPAMKEQFLDDLSGG